MTDVHKQEVRSYIMSQIKSKDTKPEMIVRMFLFKKGYRYRLHVNSLPGNPDIVLQKYKTIIFVNGCFWHAHKNCKLNKLPKSKTEYWTPKILGNVERDSKNELYLRKDGWNVITIWECELSRANKSKTLTGLLRYLKKVDKKHEIY